MTSRERILTALAGGIPDRVPVSTYELVGFNSDAFENKDSSYAALMQVIREKTDCLCMWGLRSNETFLASSAPVAIDLVEERLDGATVYHRTLHTPKGDLIHTSKVFDNVHTTWVMEHWCKSSEDIDKALSVPYEPVSYDASDLPRITRELGGNGIIMDGLADPMYLAADLMEFGQYTVWALTETEHFARTIDALGERCTENLRRSLDVHVSDLYRICGPEYATPPYVPPVFFERFVVPYVTDLVELIHARGGKARFHCHGKIGQVLDMIAATGADALDPCEAPPDGDIELADIKKRVGDRLCLCGNLQLKLLEHGSGEEVEQAVKRCMDAAKKNGGYIILPTAAPINTPLAQKTEDNYRRFIDTALEYGRY